MAMSVYGGGPVTIDETTVWGVKQWSVDPGLNAVMEHGGQTDIVFAASLESRPVLEGTFTDLAGLVGLVPWNGLEGKDVIGLLRKRKNFGGVASGSTHRRVTLRACLGVLARMSATQGQMAEATARFLPTYDGTNEPYSWTDVTDDAYAAPVNYYTVGPVKIGAVEVEVQSIEIDFGVQTEALSHSGDHRTLLATFFRREPTITIGTRDAALITDAFFGGSAGTAIELWFRKVERNARPYGDAAGEHLKVSVPLALVMAGNVSAPETAASDQQIILRPTRGTDPVFAFAAGQAISGA